MNESRLWPEGPLFRDGEHMKLTGDSVLLVDFALSALELSQGRKLLKGADLGCGSGILCLLLLNRLPGLHMTGLEIQPDEAQLARENLLNNNLAERNDVRTGDLRETVKTLPNGSFDLVISNPPFYTQREGAGGKSSPDRVRSIARGEAACSLEELCVAASILCRSGGRVFLCYKPERMTELFETLHRNRLEPKRLRIVCHNRSSRSSLLLLEARKDGRPGLMVEAPLLLYEENGVETEEYRRIYHRL